MNALKCNGFSVAVNYGHNPGETRLWSVRIDHSRDECPPIIVMAKTLPDLRWELEDALNDYGWLERIREYFRTLLG